ncbi:MAG: DEAD/DEAH box helicase, partial [Verrucomicrobia bacterium]|nr:DEAD/DEAH box helicase [Verrucomicrobiota bacterium]
LLDFRRRGDIHLSQVEVLVIDEADRMLDMGFIPDVRTIVHSTPPKNERQTLFFSATLTPEVMRLASQWTTDPVSVEIAPEQVAVDTVDQQVYIVTLRDKFALLYNILSRDNATRVLVFANRRDHSERLMENLRRYGIDCALLTGAVDQRKRLRVLEDFRAGKIRVVVATDVAGRGLHVEGISHVINYNLPMDPEDYVHRIGRTGRAGVSGISVSFADEDDGHYLPQIEKFMGRALPCIHPEDDWLVLPAPLYAAREPKFSSRRPPGRSFGPRRGGGGPRRGGRRPH